MGTFITYATANVAPLGLGAADLPAVTAARTAYTNSFAANNTAQSAAQSARQQKDADRAVLENAVRFLTRKMQASGAVNTAESAALGLNVPGTIRTPVGAPSTAPIGEVDTSQRLRHIVGFRYSVSGVPRAKPAGVEGCEIWVKVGGTPPAEPSELTNMAADTRSPYTRDFDGADSGKTAHYMLRWVSTRHEPGPWSETVSATITG